jgi:hypothetical protein
MALNECGDCTTPFAVGLPRCPHCRSTNFAEQGQNMPKITVHGGATNADEPQPVTVMVGEPGPELELPFGGSAITTSGAWADEDPEPDAAEAETEAPEEESSPGSSSSPSSETPPIEPETNKPARRSPARKTASRSKKAPTDDSSAPGTAGDQTEATSAADDADAQ